jgi:predicted  nucleic acid-binding Zn-ribbon protein
MKNLIKRYKERLLEAETQHIRAEEHLANLREQLNNVTTLRMKNYISGNIDLARMDSVALYQKIRCYTDFIKDLDDEIKKEKT